MVITHYSKLAPQTRVLCRNVSLPSHPDGCYVATNLLEKTVRKKTVESFIYLWIFRWQILKKIVFVRTRWRQSNGVEFQWKKIRYSGNTSSFTVRLHFASSMYSANNRKWSWLARRIAFTAVASAAVCRSSSSSNIGHEQQVQSFSVEITCVSHVCAFIFRVEDDIQRLWRVSEECVTFLWRY